MIKKSMMVTGVAALMLMTGCQMNDVGQQSLQRTSNPNYGPMQTNQGYYPMGMGQNQSTEYNSYGYTRYQKEQVEANGKQQSTPMFDRTELADTVSRMVLTNETVSEAATLVTDKYVLVAYDCDTNDRDYVADQVKRSAISVVPRYYEVYITDDHEHFAEIERFQNGSTTAGNQEGSLKQTIQEMRQSPQGAYNESTDDNMNVMEQKQKKLMD
ncbi:YhcN/YlaJ family sporulation lipoprotein [Alkalihalophilus lindianensis]|uniref:YhcN/YlaJ family sporulation lipoprotein n=1 Tax=Alkalihalophilus lindianensis TaxID=1630542 RepID=A0ABU3X8C5_9BACI|nr:YhcN/YlaJ family sporulation lipoprotein [Alkalihalophilus lindianensis]MDV2684146.1 YhcN/YlaJ family sporulation lipoprotein [Alkalihalophilus lindianensis]